MIWDKLANKYDSLWVQKYSLTPTRQEVLKIISEIEGKENLLDIGCGTGQLLEEIGRHHKEIKRFGMDKSEQMITCAKEKEMDATLLCKNISGCNDFDNKFDIITCCHSFPYYENKPGVVTKIHSLLKDEGTAIFAQASINSAYDRFAMWVIEKTAEKADYLSKKEFRALLNPRFEVVEEFAIKEKWFMPSICGFVVRKRVGIL